MPRLPPSLVRKAHSKSPHLATLLPACRDIPSASNELRWIQEHIRDSKSRGRTPAAEAARLSDLCNRRGKGVPLQYLLGSQPFGPLDIRCAPGVLIPRPETEAYTFHLAELIRNSCPREAHVRILDVCTGTGCIALGLYAALCRSHLNLRVFGLDVSDHAVRLARRNLSQAIRDGHVPAPGQTTPTSSITFVQADIFDADFAASLSSPSEEEPPVFEILVSNPPYISADVWFYGRRQLSPSVRRFEPRLALVPGAHLPEFDGCRSEDIFYARLLDVAQQLGSRALLLEVGDEAQAIRVAAMAAEHPYSTAARMDVELWRDAPDLLGQSRLDAVTVLRLKGGERKEIRVRGRGMVRSVVFKVPNWLK